MNPSVVKALKNAKDVRVARLQPGDVVVLKSDRMDHATADKLRAVLCTAAGGPVHLVVLDRDDDFSVVRPDKLSPGAAVHVPAFNVVDEPELPAGDVSFQKIPHLRRDDAPVAPSFLGP